MGLFHEMESRQVRPQNSWMTLLIVKDTGMVARFSVCLSLSYEDRLRRLSCHRRSLQQPKQQIWILEARYYRASLPNAGRDGTGNHWESFGVPERSRAPSGLPSPCWILWSFRREFRAKEPLLNNSMPSWFITCAAPHDYTNLLGLFVQK